MARPEELRCRPNSLTLLLDEEEENPASPVDVLRPHLGQVLEGTGGDPGMGEELIQIPLIGPAGGGGGGAEQPGGDRPADGLAEIARHLTATEGRDGVGGGRADSTGRARGWRRKPW